MRRAARSTAVWVAGLAMVAAVCVWWPGGRPSTGERLRAQARALGVTDPRVLHAIEVVPREEFLPSELRRRAAEDRSLPIEHGQTISQPSLVALMTQLAEVSAQDRVLEVGTGSGYQAAVLAELTPHVYSIEILPELASTAAARLKRLGYPAVKVRAGDGYLGWAEVAPFDAIIVTCAPDHVPEPLVTQLREGGRIVIPVGPEGGPQALYLLVKRDGKLISTEVVPVAFVPMTGRAAARRGRERGAGR